MHVPVLLQPTIEKLDIRKGDIFLDCTLGSGGHSLAVCNQWGREVEIIGIDLDREAIQRSEKSFKESDCNFLLRQGNFRHLDKILSELGIKKVDRVLMDLGWSQEQLEQSGRGFSFLREEPLIMTFKKEVADTDLTVQDIVNLSQESDLYSILKNYGEERFAGRIAGKIVEKRKEKPLETTTDLVEVIDEAVPYFYKKRKIHPATKTFQALRIAVNDELDSLKEAMEKGFARLAGGGRIAVISFHSLEDRIVKRFFKDLEKRGEGRIVTKKPVSAEEEEVKRNPRSRSAKLRVLEKI